MEQTQQTQRHTQTQAETPAEFQRDHSKHQVSGPAQTLQAVLAGVQIQSLPPRTLEELAVYVGNSAMAELLNQEGTSPALTYFSLPAHSLEGIPCAIAPPAPALTPTLALGFWDLSGPASHPQALSADGGALAGAWPAL